MPDPRNQGLSLLAVRSPADRNAQRVGFAAAAILHVALIAGLLSYAPVREALVAAAPITVDLITPPIERPPEPPKPLPVKPIMRPVLPRPIEPAPLFAITPQTAPEPATFQAPVLEVVKPLPPIEPAAPVEKPVLPTTPPSFNAAYLDNPPPRYPPLARRAGEQGRVLLRLHVTAGGLAEKVELKESSGSTSLDTTALETVKRWRFVPARQGDQAVAAWVIVPINFTLER